ncbi:MAG: T9SS type A sorting domain-containing protein [Bacteroidetes bacterium]|nr:T9SS type A sorting domain-containing protein [Bacteroidota bacterium]
MKTFNFFFVSMIISSLSFGQVDSYSEDFDSLSAGDYMGVVGAANGWTTWSGTTGTAEDVQVSDSMSNSGSNSIYFDGAPGGGAHDVLLDFGGEYNYGTFTVDLELYADSGFYWNLQGNTSPGITFPLQMYCLDDSLQINDAAFFYYYEDYMNYGEWAHFTMHMDLDSNVWTVLLNNDTLASFPNAMINQVASMDLYPLDAHHDFFIDDVMWTWDTTVVTPTSDTTQIIVGGDTAWVIDGDTFEMWDGGYVPYGVEELDNGAVSMYPNPANDVLTVSFGRKVTNLEVSLVDIQGKQVFANFKNVDGRNQSLDVTNIPSGVYIMKGSSKTFNFRKSVVIQH